MKGQYDIYPAGLHNFIWNIFNADEDIETSPLMGLRILRLLRDAQKSDSDDPFVTIDQILDYFKAMLVDSSVTIAWLSRLLETGLCLSYDPTVTNINHAGRIEIAPAGFQHLRWGTRDADYAKMMLEVTPIIDSVTYEKLASLARRPHRDVWREELECFVDYLIAEDEKYCKIPAHDAYINQRKLPLE